MHHAPFAHIDADVRNPLAATEGEQVARLQGCEILGHFLTHRGLLLRRAGEHHVERAHHVLHQTAAVEREIGLGAAQLVARADLPARLHHDRIAKILRRCTPRREGLPALERLDRLTFGTRCERDERATQAERKELAGA
jgi:hypothetical protein